ncbi:hypothetical protein RDI58_020348 [Solanum bulbocastanum]|uniref:NB-ARC domain-containing protein n=1 Tax=Solanum bulbocastanum TaxID=147425 RepID=A0AAN8TCA5_SOLBU
MCMTIWLDSTPSSKSINVLSGDDPWTLFTQKAEENLKVPPGFEEIGKKIVEECRGLPIALPTIESALYKKDLTYWDTAATLLPKQTLTRYDMELSLIPNIDRVKEARGDIHQTVEQLKAVCLLLDGDKEETVKMHDVIRDISIQIGFDQQQPKSVAKAGEKLNNWPGNMLACSCGAISHMSNHLEKLPDGVIHCLETETIS